MSDRIMLERLKRLMSDVTDDDDGVGDESE